MGMREDDFLKMTPRVFLNKAIGFYRHEDRQYKTAMDAARFTAYHVILPHLKKENVKPLLELLPFPWDNDSLAERIKTQPLDPVGLSAERWAKIDSLESKN